MGFFDASQEKPTYPDDDDEDVDIPLPQVGAFEVHSRTITSIKVPIFDPNSVITSSYDSSIRCLDLQSQVSTQLWQPDDDDIDLGISCIDLSPEAKDIIFFSTLEGTFGRFDRRAKTKAEIWSLSDNKIGGFSLNPLLPHLIATASLDRTLKIWDLRMIKGKGDLRRPSLLGEHQSRLSVSHASWSRGGYLATSSYDDTVKVYDMTDAMKWKPGQDLSAKQMKPAHVIPHNNQTGRWVTILKPQWQINPADGVEKFAIANMNRFVDIYDSKGKQLGQLDGEGITAVPAVAEFHPTLNWLVCISDVFGVSLRWFIAMLTYFVVGWRDFQWKVMSLDVRADEWTRQCMIVRESTSGEWAGICSYSFGTCTNYDIAFYGRKVMEMMYPGYRRRDTIG